MPSGIMEREKIMKRESKERLTSSEKAVRRLQRQWEESQNSVDDLVNEHTEIFEEYDRRATERNRCLDRLAKKVAETRIGAGPMDVTVSRTRVYDGKKVFNAFKDKRDLRDALVTREFKVNRREIENLFKRGQISAEELEEFSTEVKEVVRVLGRPKDLVMA